MNWKFIHNFSATVNHCAFIVSLKCIMTSVIMFEPEWCSYHFLLQNDSRCLYLLWQYDHFPPLHYYYYFFSLAVCDNAWQTKQTLEEAESRGGFINLIFLFSVKWLALFLITHTIMRRIFTFIQMIHSEKHHTALTRQRWMPQATNAWFFIFI